MRPGARARESFQHRKECSHCAAAVVLEVPCIWKFRDCLNSVQFLTDVKFKLARQAEKIEVLFEYLEYFRSVGSLTIRDG